MCRDFEEYMKKRFVWFVFVVCGKTSVCVCVGARVCKTITVLPTMTITFLMTIQVEPNAL